MIRFAGGNQKLKCNTSYTEWYGVRRAAQRRILRGGSRVSLDSIVYAFLDGESPEGIQDSYTALTLEQIFGSLAYYLANRPMIDEYLRQGEIEYDRLYEDARAKDPAFYAKLGAAREAGLAHRL